MVTTCQDPSTSVYVAHYMVMMRWFQMKRLLQASRMKLHNPSCVYVRTSDLGGGMRVCLQPGCAHLDRLKFIYE